MAFLSFQKPKNALEEGGRSAAPVHQDAGEPEEICPNCRKSIPQSKLWANQLVCTCGYHFRMKARQRLPLITDKNSFRELFSQVQSCNPLSFPGYSEKLETVQSVSGEKEAVLCGTAAIGGMECCLFVMDPQCITEDNTVSQAPYAIVKLARDSIRPTGLDYIHNLFHDFLELHGDRRYGDDPAIVGGIAWLEEIPVTVIAIEKGHTAKERASRNFGAPHPEGYRKALRLMKQAEKFGRAVVCLIDTSGAYCGIGAEERGQGQAIAENLMEMSTLCVPVISLLIGEGGSGGALALAVADRVWILDNAVYSVISPEGCASILWKDAKKAEEAAASLKLTAGDAKALGIAERTLSEKDIGQKPFYDRIRQELAGELRTLSQDPDLLQKRYDRFRALGVVKETE